MWQRQPHAERCHRGQTPTRGRGHPLRPPCAGHGATVTLSSVTVAPGGRVGGKGGGHPGDARPHPCGFQDARSHGKQSPSPRVSPSTSPSISTPSMSPSPLMCAPPRGQPSCFAFTFLFLPHAPPGTGRWLSAEATGPLPGDGLCYKSTGRGEGQCTGAGNLCR